MRGERVGLLFISKKLSCHSLQSVWLKDAVERSSASAVQTVDRRLLACLSQVLCLGLACFCQHYGREPERGANDPVSQQHMQLGETSAARPAAFFIGGSGVPRVCVAERFSYTRVCDSIEDCPNLQALSPENHIGGALSP